ncbi:Cytochrome P450 monooxygenase lolP1 [Colletotrichum aenigma]|nr:Cytochrome P450 monooxygenase lolP1 [Colletotrichum aenigma]KAF5507897.1 Cytochrome P450 monooxygenase lolP1 [Colletotrichum aenigma]
MFRIRCHGSRAYSEYARLTAQYGKLVRIGPNDVITSDPELIRRMSAAKSTYERSSWYKATRLDPYHDMMGSVLDKSAHHSLRTKLSPGYVGKDIPGLEASIDSGIAELVDLIRLKYTSRSKAANIPETGEKDQVSKPSDSESVDFGRLADYYAMDARSRMSFGRPIGLLQKDTDVFGLIRTSNIAIDVLQFFTDIPALQMIFTSDLVLRLLGPKPTDSSGFGKIMGRNPAAWEIIIMLTGVAYRLAQQHVVKRFAPDAKDEPDLLGSFIRRGLDQRSAQSEIMFPMVAGSDTAAKAIKWTMQYLLSNPSNFKSLEEEVMTAISNGTVSEPITNIEALKLPFLQAVIYESLRVHPPFTGLLMKQVGPEGDVHQGTFLPPGTRVAHDTWSVTHDTQLFGEDAHIFRPQRWLEADATTVREWKKRTELVFGAGRWQCAGKAVAMIELNKIFVTLIRNFEFLPTSASIVPPNVKTFDYAYIRGMTSSISDWPEYLEKVYNGLAGGYIELFEGHARTQSDDESLTPEHAMLQWADKLDECCKILGRPFVHVPSLVPKLKEAYFVDMKIVPLVARLSGLSEGLEAWTIAALTRALNWSYSEVQTLLSEVRKDMNDRSFHHYTPLTTCLQRSLAIQRIQGQPHIFLALVISTVIKFKN